MMNDPFAMLRRKPFGPGAPNTVPQEGQSIGPTGWYGQHDYSSSIGQTNVLLDPTLETLSDGASTIGTSATANGLWSAHYVLTSGTAPATRRLSRYLPRGFPSINSYNSALALLFMSGSAAFVGDVYLYPGTDFHPNLTNVLDFLVAGVRVLQQDAISNIDVLTVQLEIYDSSSSSVVATSGDPVDLVALGLNTPKALMAAYTTDESTFRGDRWRWRLKVHVEKQATSGQFFLLFAEPQLHFNYIPDLLPYAPLIGNWYPPTGGSGLDINAASNQITPTLRGQNIFTLSASGGSVTLTSTPTIPDGIDGQELILLFVGSANTVTIQDQGTLAGSNLRLTASSIALGPRDSVRLVYSAAVGDWVQIGSLVSVL